MKIKKHVSLVVLLTLVGTVQAYDFRPTDAEWLAWPVYCKARYLTLDIGHGSKWRGTMSREQIEAERSRLGADTFEGIHHYCAGIAWLNRAQIQQDPNRRAFELRTAKMETLFTYDMLPDDTTMYGPIAVQLARVMYLMQEYAQAEEVLKKAIAREPLNPLAYSALAIIYRDQGDTARAREVLLEGDNKIQGESPELWYNLGLILLELGDVELAASYGRKAYRAGFPLPGLRRKLEALNAWEASN